MEEFIGVLLKSLAMEPGPTRLPVAGREIVSILYGNPCFKRWEDEEKESG